MDCSICYEKFITHKHNNTHICPIPNCGCLICGECWIKITHKSKDLYTANIDDMPTKFDKFICPYCRIVDWKYYMNNVFDELQQHVLGMDEWKIMFNEKVFALMTGL